MRSVAAINLLALVVQAHAEEASVNSVHDARDSLRDSVFSRQRLSTSLHRRLGLIFKKANAPNGPVPRRLNEKQEKLMPWSRPPIPRTISSWDPDAKRKVFSKGDSMVVVKSVFNLIKNIVGSGVLSLAAGVAAIGGERALLIPAMLMMTSMGILSAYTFYSIGRQCHATGATTFIKAWAESVNKRSSWVVMLVGIIYPFMGCLCYSIIIGDSFSALAKGGILGPFLERNPIALDRRTWILAFAVVVLYPLSSLNKLSFLAPSSLLGVGAVAYTLFFMMLRYFDGSYLPGGRFYDSLSKVMQPSFSSDGLGSALKQFFSRFGTFALLGMSETAYIAHLNAPAFYDEAGRDTAKFALISGLGVGVSIVINLLFLVLGFLTFGSSSAGSILNSYARTDVVANVARALFAICVITSYPVVFQGLKPALKAGLMPFKSIKDGVLLNQAITILPMLCITGTALFVSNLGLASTFCGAIGGSALIFIFPSLMYLSRPPSDASLLQTRFEKAGNIAVLILGVLLAVLGTASPFL